MNIFSSKVSEFRRLGCWIISGQWPPRLPQASDLHVLCSINFMSIGKMRSRKEFSELQRKFCHGRKARKVPTGGVPSESSL